jgi:hypothetical protein
MPTAEPTVRSTLPRAYATSAFSEAVKELHRKIGTSPKEEYRRLERIPTEARVKSEQASLALETPRTVSYIGGFKRAFQDRSFREFQTDEITPMYETV